MSSAGHYADFRDFRDPDGGVSRKYVRQIMRDKTDEYDDSLCNGLIVPLTHTLGTNTKCPKCIEYQSKQEYPWGGNTPIVESCRVSYCVLTEGHLGNHTALPNAGIISHNIKPLETKPSNPKDIIGSDKVPMGLVPAVTMAYLSLGHLEGDLKYGRTNWREAGVRTMIYVDACLRHIEKFKDGEWADPSTQVPHLANALACLSIIIDAHHAGKLNDDRPKSTEAAKVIDELSSVVKNLKTLHGSMKPTDYLINGPKPRE